MTKKASSVIQSDFYLRNQSWILDEIHEIGGRKIRTRICRNAFDNQSYGVVEVWTGTEWSEVVKRDIAFLSCKSTSYVDPDHKREAAFALFTTDAVALREQALAVLR